MATGTAFALIFATTLVVLLFLLWLGLRNPAKRAKANADGVQEIEVVVNGRYTPSTIVVRKGVPVRLNFTRREDNPCSDRVIFSDFHAGARLPAYQTTRIEFVPDKAGDFLFTCAMGMYQGRLIVEERGRQ